MSFREKWLNAVDRKNSVLCAGLDPAEFEMGRGKKGLPSILTDKRDWALEYVEAVAPFCAAVKPNIQYWKNAAHEIDVGTLTKRMQGDMKTLEEVSQLAHSLGMVVIDDSKLADIGSTNEAGMYHSEKKGADAVTLALFAGNMEEAAEQLEKWDIGGIHMCLMSNPEYEREKMKLVPVTRSDLSTYARSSATMGKTIDGVFHTYQYLQLAHDASRYGIDGIVIGAPSKKNHIEGFEIEKVRAQVRRDMLVLLPGVGAQGGEADAIWKYFAAENVIVNVGRSLMLPNGSNSTPDEQAATAKHYMEMLNELRDAA